MNHQPEISIVVPTYNRKNLLVKTINYLAGLNYHSYEIIIVDQSGQYSEAPKSFNQINDNKIRYFKVSEQGLPEARNYGISKASGEIILFCDDDIIPSQNLVIAHIKNYNDPSIAGVAGRIASKKNIKKNRKIGIINRYTT